MIYTSREKLTCFCLEDGNDEVEIWQFNSLLMENPANVIYGEKAGRLYGIISMGDIHRAHEAGKDYVTVNKCFTSIRSNEYMRVKQIFKDNQKINALPVVNVDNVLMGEYSRWDDYVAVNVFEQLKYNKYAEDFWKKNKKIALVNPCRKFLKKQRLMQIWYDNLVKIGVQVSVIGRESVLDIFELVDYVLFTDEDELRGTGTLYKDILNQDFDWYKAKTYDAIRDVMGDMIGDEILKSVVSNGIHVFTLNVEDNKSDYWKILQRNIDEKFFRIGQKRAGVLHEEFRPDFFAELYNEPELFTKQYLN